jgi:glycosyl transferase, family 25
MNIKVINLRRSPERRAAFEQANPELDYEFFDARDGRLLTLAEQNDPAYFIQPLPFPGPGAYGVALSHLQLWNDCIESGVPTTVAEDDAVFRADFSEQAEKILKGLPEDWDFVLWGWNFDSLLSVFPMGDVSPVVMLFNQDSLRQNIESFRMLRNSVQPLPLDKCFGIPAYTISPAGARKFRDLCFPMIDVKVFFPFLNREIGNTGVDLAMNNIYACTRSYVAFPPLVVTANDHAISTIQTGL